MSFKYKAHKRKLHDWFFSDAVHWCSVHEIGKLFQWYTFLRHNMVALRHMVISSDMEATM